MTESTAPVPTVTELLWDRAEDPRPGLRFDNDTWSWAEHVAASADRAALLATLLREDRPRHVGVLLDNVPEFSFLLGASAFGGTVLVGLNPQRRGDALARDIATADCQLVLTDSRHGALLDGLHLPGVETIDLESPQWTQLLDQHRDGTFAPVAATPDDLLMLVFTSGTGGEPKAVRCTHAKFGFPGRMLADRFGLGSSDVVYVSMPLFHSNALIAGWSVGLAAGATLALRPRFSASAFLSDVRRFGATYANYVGKPLSYVLATEARSDDHDNPLRIAYGNEGARRDLVRFAERFDCQVVDGFGSTEGGVAVSGTPDTPPGALGRPAPGVAVADPETGQLCPPARFDADGRVVNLAEATGELVNTSGPGWFTGYYKNPEADASRMRHGMYWSGDLGYLDEAGFCYFVGRSQDWMRVDGENLGTAEIERILLRHPHVTEAAVYAVPDESVGDQVMAALVLADGHGFVPSDFADFLGAQRDLGPKQVPRYVRVTPALPRTSTFKVVKRVLAEQRWECADPVWWRAGSDLHYQLWASD